jgi:G3E family GTPase
MQVFWWASMPYQQRIRYNDFVENRELIEKNWSKDFGDRHNELVFIGEHLNKEELTQELNNCLITDAELLDFLTGKVFVDPFNQ